MRFTACQSAVLTFAICIVGLGCNGATVSYVPGPIQAIGNSNQLLVFLEIDRLVDSGLRHLDAPGRQTVGHKQELLIINSSGEGSRQVLPNNKDGSNGRTFHPNNGAIFRAEEKFYLLSFRSKDYKPTLFEWNGARFSRSTEQENARLLAKFRLNGTIIEQEAAIKELEQQSGWRRLYSETVTKSDSFEWNGKVVNLNVSNQLDKFVITVQLDGLNPFATNLVYEYEEARLTRSEVRSLAREESPHSK
jgi:hypothetical protein